MEVLVPYSGVLYAVIQASSKKDGPERLVISYQNEDCLRDLIAASSIVGLGFASRDEAMANIESRMSDAAPSKPMPRTTAMFHVVHEKGHLLHSQGLVAHAGKFQGIVHSVLATLAVFFYSKSVLSALIRVALGASF